MGSTSGKLTLCTNRFMGRLAALDSQLNHRSDRLEPICRDCEGSRPEDLSARTVSGPRQSSLASSLRACVSFR